MNKAIKCTGYAFAGAVGIFLALGAVGAFMFVNIFAADIISRSFGLGLSKDSAAGLGMIFMFAEIGAFFGAMICKEINNV